MYSLSIHYCDLTLQRNPVSISPLRDIHHNFARPKDLLMLALAILFIIVGIVHRPVLK